MNKDFYIYRHAWRYNGAPDCEPELSEAQSAELLQDGGWLVRNTFDFDCEDKTDFWYIIKDSFDGLEELSSNVRRKIHKAGQYIEYRRVDIKIIRDSGYPIVKATFDDYNVKDRIMNAEVFNNYLDECGETKFDYWGIFDKETKKFIGFCTVHIWDNCCEYGVSAIWPEYKRNATYPYYGLYHTMNTYYLNELKFKYVSDSARSITEHSHIHQFLEQNFKFRKAYCKLKITYKWWFGIIVRLLYPFRNIIPNRNIQAVLKMHGMQTL